MRNDYIELNRTFAELTDEELGESNELLIKYLRSKKTYSWHELLDNFNYIVILGEAGSGKTKELENRCRILSEKEEYAFFCKIESLAEVDNFRKTLRNQEEQKIFDNWIEDDKIGFFFLDSVDEARLKEKSFEEALRHLSISMPSKKFLRTKIIISCRASDWKARFDKVTFQKFLPAFLERKEENELEKKTLLKDSDFSPQSHEQTKTETQKIEVSIFTLKPLNMEQVKTFVKYIGADNYDNLINTINENNYWHLVERPQDVEWLSNYWKDNKKLDSYLKLIQHNVDKKLQEFDTTRPKIGEVSMELLYEGAEKLASAIILCKKSFIALPDEYTIKSLLENSINPKEILKDWESNKINNLLSRGIFDEATYGKVQFHHRAVVEFLTANFFKDLINNKSPKPGIFDLLFGDSFGEKVIKPYMQPIVAWLSLLDNEVLSKVVKEFPEVLINYGNPSSIDESIRKRILINYCEKYKDFQTSDIGFEDVSLRRFVSLSFEIVIIGLFKEYVDRLHIKILLIRLIGEGKLKRCKDILFKTVLTATEKVSVRMWAMESVVKLDDEDTCNNIVKYFMANVGRLPFQIEGFFIELFYPNKLTLNQFIDFVQASEPNWNKSGESVPGCIYKIVNYNFPNDKLEEFLTGLINIINAKITNPLNQSRNRLYNYRKICETIPIIVIKLLEIKEKTVLEINLIDDALEILSKLDLHSSYFHLEKEKIRQLISFLPKIKRNVFFGKLKKNKENIKYLSEFSYFYHDFWNLNILDSDWLLNDLLNNKINNKHIILDALLYITRDSQHSKSEYEKIKNAVMGEKDLLEHFNSFMNPPKNRKPDFELEDKRIEKKRKIEARKRFKENRKYLSDNIDKIKDAKAFNALHFLYEELASQGVRDSLGQTNIETLDKTYGKKIGLAAKEGFKKFWRTYTPPLPHETNSKGSIEYGVLVGLTGIAIELSEDKLLENITEKDAEIAVHYALKELNSFSYWLIDIAKIYPNSVSKILNKCIINDFSASLEENFPDVILRKLSYSDKILKKLCSPIILKLLGTKKLLNIQILNYSLSIILDTKLSESSEFFGLVKRNAKYNKNKIKYFLPWFGAWLMIDHKNAIKYLEGLSNKLNLKEADELVLKLCNELYESRDGYRSLNLNIITSINSVKIFLKIVYKHIRREEDTVHYGGYTPDKRDHAEYFRGRLLDYLISIPGYESYSAIMELSQDPIFSYSKDRFINIAREKAEKESDKIIWNEKDVYSFSTKFSKGINTDEELFYYVFEKLKEIKNHIEIGDKSTRGLFNSNLKETEIQKWIADRLELICSDKISIVREEEVDDFKKPDIRIRKDKMIIGIEIKISHKYTLQQLSDSLKNQLIKHYLKDVNARHGIFLLIHLHNKKWINKKTNKKMNIIELTDYLIKESKNISIKNQLKNVKVLYIDFIKTDCA